LFDVIVIVIVIVLVIDVIRFGGATGHGIGNPSSAR
jgi:uncharacterized membrane protein